MSLPTVPNIIVGAPPRACGELTGDPPEDLAHDELLHHPRRPLEAHGRTDDPLEAHPPLGRVPHGEEEIGRAHV